MVENTVGCVSFYKRFCCKRQDIDNLQKLPRQWSRRQRPLEELVDDISKHHGQDTHRRETTAVSVNHLVPV